jgi:hypothetical protein
MAGFSCHDFKWVIEDMAIEIGAVCSEAPNLEVTARVSGLIMRATLGIIGTEAHAEKGSDAWVVNWGDEASALLTLVGPGRHEFDDAWYLSVQPGQRGMDAHLLFTVIVAASAALITDGFVLDEIGVFGGGKIAPGLLLDRILVPGGTDVNAALDALSITREKR